MGEYTYQDVTELVRAARKALADIEDYIDAQHYAHYQAEEVWEILVDTLGDALAAFVEVG
jgi:hypothetical protein